MDLDALSDLYRVGPDKPIGYLPLSTIKKAGAEPRRLYKEMKGRGLSAHLFSEGESQVCSGALYVWDVHSLQKLLDINTDILDAAGWPRAAEEFVKRVVVDFAEYGSIYELVGVAFADKRWKNSFMKNRVAPEEYYDDHG
jgi:hypothetical protein